MKTTAKTVISLLIALTLLAGLHPTAAQVAFAPAVNYTVGDQPLCAIAADVNGDGKPDLICASYSDPYVVGKADTLSVLTNDGSGGFVFATSVPVISDGGDMIFSVVSADVNGDGNPDLVCIVDSYSHAGAVETFTNNGHGGFVLSRQQERHYTESHFGRGC